MDKASSAPAPGSVKADITVMSQTCRAGMAEIISGLKLDDIHSNTMPLLENGRDE